MAKKEKEKPAVLTLDEKEYVIDEMTDEEKMLLNHINDMQSELADLELLETDLKAL